MKKSGKHLLDIASSLYLVLGMSHSTILAFDGRLEAICMSKT